MLFAWRQAFSGSSQLFTCSVMWLWCSRWNYPSEGTRDESAGWRLECFYHTPIPVCSPGVENEIKCHFRARERPRDNCRGRFRSCFNLNLPEKVLRGAHLEMLWSGLDAVTATDKLKCRSCSGSTKKLCRSFISERPRPPASGTWKLSWGWWTCD